MEKKTWKLMVAICVTVYLVPSFNAIESPHYSAIHSESDFEIRIYKESTWMSAPVNHLSFHQATKLGFHRCSLQETKGPYSSPAGNLNFVDDSNATLWFCAQCANLNFSRIPMTKPVLTSIVPGAGPLHSSSYVVRFYLPVKFQATPPLPLPELNLKPVSWPSHCVAVRKFSGFAGDSNVVTEAEKLATILGRSQWANLTSSDNKNAYSIAQYNSPFRIFNRVNEVWVNVEGSESDNCMSSGMATY